MGGCPRIKEHLRKGSFVQILSPLSLNGTAIHLDCMKNLTKNDIRSYGPCPNYGQSSRW